MHKIKQRAEDLEQSHTVILQISETDRMHSY